MKSRRSKESGKGIPNTQIAEWLADEADKARYPIQRALRSAGRAALLWPDEVAELARQKRRLTELPKIGPFIERQILDWLEHPPREKPMAEIRRDFIAWPEAQKILAEHPDWGRDLKGDLQMHTEWSDGSGTVRDMARAGLQKGYQYISLTDHGKTLKIAGGVSEAELRRQWEEIEIVNREFAPNNFRVLRSIEMNLDTEGRGDMDADTLEQLDIVHGAFHGTLRKTEDQTERYLAALRNPHLDILGHPRGRIYNYRLGLKADWERVFAFAAEQGKALEIDCYPDRQDLNVELLKLAKKAGGWISLGTDAHHPWQLQFIDFGLAAALKAGIPKSRILNFLTCDELLKWAKR